MIIKLFHVEHIGRITQPTQFYNPKFTTFYHFFGRLKNFLHYLKTLTYININKVPYD